MTEPPQPNWPAAVTGEQRLHARHRVRWPVLLRRKSHAGSMMFRAHTVEMSISGMGVVAEVNLGVGEILACRLTVRPHGGSNATFDIDAAVRVIYAAYSREARGFGAGLQFHAFDGKSQSDLAGVLLAFGNAIPTHSINVVRSWRHD